MVLSKKKGTPYWHTRFSIGGIRVQESTRTTSRKEAQRYEDRRRAEIREQIERGDKPKFRWIDAEKRWLMEKQYKRSIVDDIRWFEWLQPHIGHMYLDDIDKRIISETIVKKEQEGVSPASLNRLAALIRAVLNQAYKNWGWIEKVPTIQMRKEDNKRIRWLTHGEAELLLSHLPKHLNIMARFTLATGLRASNVFLLEWEHVDLINRHLIVPDFKFKADKNFGIPLNELAVQILRGQIGQHERFVFVYNNKPVTQVSTRAFRKALIRTGIKDFRWHDFRHTWASWHVQNGTSLQELMELGGWASLDMVQRYAHLSSSHLQRAAENVSGAKLVKRDFKVIK